MQADDADLTISINREDLVQAMMGTVSFDDQIASGKARLKGDRDVIEQLKTMLVSLDLGFELFARYRCKRLHP